MNWKKESAATSVTSERRGGRKHVNARSERFLDPTPRLPLNAMGDAMGRNIRERERERSLEKELLLLVLV